MHYQVERLIDAAPAAVWAVLTDARKLAGGGLGILRIDGDIAAGASLRLWTEAQPKRAFALKVSAFEPNERMIWEGGMPFGLFRGVRRYSLNPENGRTRFAMREEFSGILLPLIARSMPDLGPSFEAFGDGLKRMVEEKA